MRPFVVGALELSGILPAARRRHDSRRAVILTYHSISTAAGENETYRSPEIATSPEAFVRQMRHLEKHYLVAPLGDLVERLVSGRGFPPNCVAITFDDGYKDNYTVALPILKQFGFPATVFVTTDAIGDGWAFWPARVRAILMTCRAHRFRIEGLGEIVLGEPSERRAEIKRITRFLKGVGSAERRAMLEMLLEASGLDGPVPDASGWMMTWDDVRAMSGEGIDFGSHTCSHPILTTLSDDEVIREIVQSRDILREKIGKPVLDMAYPNGSDGLNFDSRVSGLVSRCGFRSASTSRTGPILPDSDRFQLSRISISERHKLDGFALALEQDHLLGPIAGRRGGR